MLKVHQTISVNFKFRFFLQFVLICIYIANSCLIAWLSRMTKTTFQKNWSQKHIPHKNC